LLRRPARLLIGAAFVASGVEVLRDRDRRARRVEGLGLGDPQAVTRALAGVQIGAGSLLVLGRFPRLAALALAATVVPEAVSGHAFWQETDKHERDVQRSLFTRDLGLLGGLLISVADTGGRESIPHRARRNAAAAKGRAAAALP
jgi:putative oxidoreductase